MVRWVKSSATTPRDNELISTLQHTLEREEQTDKQTGQYPSATVDQRVAVGDMRGYNGWLLLILHDDVFIVIIGSDSWPGAPFTNIV